MAGRMRQLCQGLGAGLCWVRLRLQCVKRVCQTILAATAMYTQHAALALATLTTHYPHTWKTLIVLSSSADSPACCAVASCSDAICGHSAARTTGAVAVTMHV